MKYKTIRAILKLVLAECRGSRQMLIFFVICIGIGVGAVMSVKSFSVNIAGSIQKESKSLIASDLEIRGSWPLSNAEIRSVKQLADGNVQFQTVVQLNGMALIEAAENRPESSILVELKAVPEDYPYYGKMEVSPQSPFQELLLGNSALVEESFLIKNEMQIGDFFQLGESRLRIKGTIKKEPDRAISVFSFGPRIMISRKILDQTKLIQPGSRVRYKTKIKIPDGLEVGPLTETLKKSLSGSGMTVQSYKQAQPALRETIKRFELFLVSVGVIALLVGGVGVAMITGAFLQLKVKNIAILKCLGARSSQVLSVYLGQVLLLGLIGSLLGIAGGFGIQDVISSGVNRYFNISITHQWDWKPALEAFSLGMIATLIFSLWPLLRARRTSPAKLLRWDDENQSVSSTELNPVHNKGLFKRMKQAAFDPDRMIAAVVMVSGLILMTFWQAGSLRGGFIFFSGIVGAATILVLVTKMVLKLLKKLPKAKSITRRYGISNLYRPNSQATSIVTAIGVGIMLILTVRLIQSDLLDFINKRSPVDAPNFFFIDIQPDQEESFKKAVKKIPSARLTDMVPIVRSRLHALSGKPIKEMEFENERTRRFFNREFVLTYSDSLPEDNKVVEGEWWGKTEKSFPVVSVEKDVAKTFGISLGSEVTLSIQGMFITAKVTSLRSVNWNNRRTNFYMIFSPGSLKDMPYSFVATVQVPGEDELELQTSVVKSLPNVSAINTRQIMVRAQEVLNRVSLLVRMLSVFTIATGLVILSGAIASTKFRRMREAAVLKTLGATKKTIALILGYEYFLLGLIAGGVGSLLSVLFSYVIDEYLVNLDWVFRPFPVIAAVVATAFLVLAVGLLSSWNILNNKPLQTLRHEG